jgi:hypothetical protein
MARKLILLLIVSFAGIYAAHAIGIGGEGLRFGRLGATAGTPIPAVPLVQCASTGIFNLANTCNDIYFIGALK